MSLYACRILFKLVLVCNGYCQMCRCFTVYGCSVCKLQHAPAVCGLLLMIAVMLLLVAGCDCFGCLQPIATDQQSMCWCLWSCSWKCCCMTQPRTRWWCWHVLCPRDTRQPPTRPSLYKMPSRSCSKHDMCSSALMCTAITLRKLATKSQSLNLCRYSDYFLYFFLFGGWWCLLGIGTAIIVILLVIDVWLECGPMLNLMVTLPNIGGALCSMPQRLTDAHYLTAVQ